MNKIPIKKLKPILSQKKFEYKYLSPHIFKHQNFFYLLYCNRKYKNIFQGEINCAKSKDLVYWKKINEFSIKPDKNSKYHSYLSPSFLKTNKENFIFLEGQKKNGSDILCYKSKNFNKWTKIRFKPHLSGKQTLFQSPFLFDNNNKIYLFYSMNKKFINCIDLNKKKKIRCFSANKISEKFSIYSPSILKFKNKFYMFYAAWKDGLKGNINIACSNNLKKWKKIKQNIFNIKDPIQIISEPCLIKKEKKIYFYFEYKKKSNWNISYKVFSFSKFEKLIS